MFVAQIHAQKKENKYSSLDNLLGKAMKNWNHQVTFRTRIWRLFFLNMEEKKDKKEIKKIISKALSEDSFLIITVTKYVNSIMLWVSK